MKIYTYYENVGIPNQEETLALWSGKQGDFMNWLDLCIKYKSILKEKIKQDHAQTGREYYGNDFFLGALEQEFQHHTGTILLSDRTFLAEGWDYHHNKPRDLSRVKMVHFSTRCSSAYANFNKINSEPRIARNLFIREFLNI
jgi:hypothetical protein